MKKILRTLMFITLILPLSGCLPLIFAGFSGAALPFAKNRPVGVTVSDLRIASAIKAIFIENNFRNLYSKITVEVFSGRVLLTGRVDTKEDMQTAVRLAESQKGVVEVINELKVVNDKVKFDAGQYTRDSVITSQIKSKILVDREINFVNFNVTTVEQTVYLFGTAQNEDELKKAAEIAANVNGVKKVVSHVTIASKPMTSNKNKTYRDVVASDDEKIVVKDIDTEFSKY